MTRKPYGRIDDANVYCAAEWLFCHDLELNADYCLSHQWAWSPRKAVAEIAKMNIQHLWELSETDIKEGELFVRDSAKMLQYYQGINVGIASILMDIVTEEKVLEVIEASPYDELLMVREPGVLSIVDNNDSDRVSFPDWFSRFMRANELLG